VTYLASASGHNRNDSCIRLNRVHDVYDGLQLACTELIVVEALTKEAPSATRNTGAIHSRLWRRSTVPPSCRGRGAAAERDRRDVPCLRPTVCRPYPLNRSSRQPLGQSAVFNDQQLKQNYEKQQIQPIA